MYLVWISEQTAIIYLYSIDWLVFITKTECVYCAVRTEYIYIYIYIYICIYIYIYIYIMEVEFMPSSFKCDTKFNWSPSSRNRVIPCGLTDGHDNANSRFSQFCERAYRGKEHLHSVLVAELMFATDTDIPELLAEDTKSRLNSGNACYR